MIHLGEDRRLIARVLARMPMLLMLTAAGIAGMLLFVALAKRDMAGCSVEQGCASVLTSRWAYVAGVVPVSALGLALYLATLGSWFTRATRLTSIFHTSIVTAAIWFSVVQLCILRSFCIWCSATHTCAVSAVIMRWIIQREQRKGLPRHPDKVTNHIITAAIVMAVALIQIAGPGSVNHRVYPAKEVVDVNRATATPRKTMIPQVEIGHSDIVTIFGDHELRLSAAAVPSLTSTADEAISAKTATPFLFLHDWTCEHCHILHQLLEIPQVHSDFSRRILSIPVYRDDNGEKVHRLMLTAWLQSRELYSTTAAAIIEGRLKPQPDTIASYLITHNGPGWEAAYERLRPTVESYLDMGARILAASEARLSVSTIPQLIAPQATLVGAPDPDDLRTFFQESLSSFELGKSALSKGHPPSTNRTSRAEDPTPPADVAPPKNSSRLELTAMPLRLPSMEAGRENVVTITIANTGTELLDIVGVRTSCGCMVINDWKQKVPPGERGSISINFRAPASSGLVTKTLGLRCNAANSDPAGYITIPFQVEVTPALDPPQSPPAASLPAGLEEMLRH